MSRLRLLAVLILISVSANAQNTVPPPGPTPGPFFEAEQPFFQSQVQISAPPAGRTKGGNFVVRGIVLRLGARHAAVFDQELLRLAALWEVPPDQPLTTLQAMSQISYVARGRRVNAAHPEPTGPVLLASGVHPGAAASVDALFVDPRPAAREGDDGRGPLPAEQARFEGIELAGDTAVLNYRVGDTHVREWHEIVTTDTGIHFFRHFEVAPRSTPLHVGVGLGPWTLATAVSATKVAANGANVNVASNSSDVTLSPAGDELIASFAPSNSTRRLTLAYVFSARAPGTPLAVPATPDVPKAQAARRWTETVTTHIEANLSDVNGLAMDALPVPEENPWKRRVRAADVAFLTNDRAAVVTYEGDVWLVDGFGHTEAQTLTWRRHASGLSEPLAIVAATGILQVATRNGVIRLHDRDTNGEVDWFENFNDHLLQSKSTRSFALDMDLGPDGSTYITQGGITTPSGIASGGTGTAHTGAILKISPDGRSSRLFASKAREPFVSVHPVTGVVTATDQQGHYTPSSVVYHVKEGNEYGFPEKEPTRIDPALTWIPHEQDPSSSSQEWMMGEGLGPWNGRLLHLSYNTGRLFLISPDLDAPIPQGAVIPLNVRTELPLLHARNHPRGDAVVLAGFQIWGSRAPTHSGLVRLRPGKTPVTSAIDARSTTDGVVLQFATPIDPASLAPEKVNVRLWNYVRSSSYGSGRFALDGEAGTTPWGVAQVVPSADRRSVFIHLPGLPPAMQVEVRHDFLLTDGTPARGEAFFTIHQPAPMDLRAAGFPPIDFTVKAAVIAQVKEPPPTMEAGRALSESLGCIACHSTDGTTEGKVGPTWRNLYLSPRTFVDGTTDVADEVYLREKILEPTKRRVSATPVEMPSYRGVLSEAQLESVILYIRSLRAPPRRAP